MTYFIKRKFRDISHTNIFFGRLYSLLNNVKANYSSVISDDLYAKMKYYDATKLKLNLKNPITFNEKLWWLKINYRTPLMTKCSDKVEVHKYLDEIGLGCLSNPIRGVYDTAEDVPFSEMNGKFFIKCNHVSGVNAFFDSKNESSFNRKRFNKEFNKALKVNYYHQTREWNYKNIVPKILVEDFIESQSTLLDYRFFCFHGKVKLIFVDTDTASEDGKHNPNSKRNIYDEQFNLQDFTVGRENFDESLVEKPDNLQLMIEYAEKIANPFIFCRVDLYNNEGKISFGEITFYPSGGTQQFSNEEADLLVSSWLDIK
ncbi:carboxylate--amine ligase [Psychrobacter frigidicola]|uniref:Carboxylate--amine ligase n=1 Tax=Psychrobacter frigidicola TaxID=45611 RepID=A0A5C7A4E9_9GAMM|nr:ATP-grasp fold amidoligase family protein [Psychrobacter frigidicola]TXD97494.1 carboxylate--amine ligase [Psychrobacter frigidicola]